MKHTILTLLLLLTRRGHAITIIVMACLCLSSCFLDTTERPHIGSVGRIVGCMTQDGELYCLKRYEPSNLESGVYHCTIDDVSQAYDGDTISRVRILVATADLSTLERLGEMFPNVVLQGDGVYVQNGVRIAGIDTPELRPSTKKRDGTVRSERSRENEKKAAINARNALRTLLEDNALRFTLRNVEMDKYGRILADVWVNEIDVAAYLIENRLALPYFGGTRQELDWDVLGDGFMVDN